MLLVVLTNTLGGNVFRICYSWFTLVMASRVESHIPPNNDFLAQAISIPVGPSSASRLATTIVVFPLFFSSIVYFSHRRSARIKKIVYRKLIGAPKNLRVDTSPGLPLSSWSSHDTRCWHCWRPSPVCCTYTGPMACRTQTALVTPRLVQTGEKRG